MTARKCKCIGASGVLKHCYLSKSAAMKSAVRSGRGLSRTYRCPTSKNVWHITKGRTRWKAGQ